MSAFMHAMRTVAAAQAVRVVGRVTALRGLTVLVTDLPLPVGSLVAIPRSGPADPLGDEAWVDRRGEARLLPGEVIGFDGRSAIVMMLGAVSGVRPGDEVIGLQAAQTVAVGDALLGRVIDGLGRPIDGLGAVAGTSPREIEPRPIWALRRQRVTEPIRTGVRAIDLMTPMGRGQRMGIFAGPGVGKSTLMATIARRASADVSVLALVGERGREVKDFVEHVLGPEGLRRSVVVASTGDESPLMRIRAALVATAVAEHFRDRGRHVMLLVDSITRFAHAQRQVGLSVGEPPATKGYTPSVFSGMARLLERAGAMSDGGGSVTGLYTILVEGDDMTEPVADAARGILDGHLILSRSLAQKAHYPAIDVLDSISRVDNDVADAAHTAARRQVMRLLAQYREIEDLVQIGAYARGSNAEADVALAYHPRLQELLRQEQSDFEAFDASRARMIRLAMEAGAALAAATGGAGGAGGAGARRAGSAGGGGAGGSAS